MSDNTFEFVYVLTPVRPNFIEDINEAEQAIMREHFLYLQELINEDRLVLAGPCLDGAFGIVIGKAESDQAARNIMENDPAVVKSVMTAELHPFRISLMQSPRSIL